MRQGSKGQGRSDVDGNCVGCGLHSALAVLHGRTSWHSVEWFLQLTTKLPNPPHSSVRWRLCCLHRKWSGVEMEVDIPPSN